MITTIIDYFGYDVPYKERYHLIKEAGFDGVLLYWSDEFGNIDYKKNPEIAREAGLFVENIHTSFDEINDLWLDNLHGDEIIDYLMQCIDDCHEQKISTMIVHITSGFNPPTVNNLFIDRMKKLVERAEKLGVNIALENLRKAEYLEYVFGKITSNRLGFCYDSGHHNSFSKNLDLLSMYGDKLMSLHLHDNDGISDHHQLPFDGNINWNAIMNKLTDVKYGGPIALEIMRKGYEHVDEPSEFLAIAYERAKRLADLR